MLVRSDNKQEQRSFAIDLRAVQETQDQLIVECYASVFGVVDSYGSVFMPGAFTESLMEGASRVKVLWNHNSNDVIGRLVDAKEDALGLLCTMQLTKGVQRAEEVFKNIKAGAIDQVSIGFRILDERMVDNQWEITKVKLYEVSPVTFASNPLAAITDARSANPCVEEVREILEEIQINQALATLQDISREVKYNG